MPIAHMAGKEGADCVRKPNKAGFAHTQAPVDAFVAFSFSSKVSSATM